MRVRHVKQPDPPDPVGAEVLDRLIGQHHQVPAGQRQRRMRVPASPGRRLQRTYRRKNTRVERNNMQAARPPRPVRHRPVQDRVVQPEPPRTRGSLQRSPVPQQRGRDRIRHVKYRQDEVVVAGRHRRRGAEPPARPVQPVHAEARDGQEAHLDWRRRRRHVVDPHPGAELLQPVGVLAELAAEVLRLVQVLLAVGVVRLVGDQQEPVAELQVQRPGARRRRHVRHRLRAARVVHVHHAEAPGERVRHERVPVRQHDLQRIGAAREVAGRKQPHSATQDPSKSRHENLMLMFLTWV